MQISLAGGRDVAVGAGVSRVLLLGARLASHDLAGMFHRLIAPSAGRLHYDEVVAPTLMKVWDSDGTLSALNLGWDLVLMVESAARIAMQPQRYASVARVLCVAARAVGGAVALVEPPPAPLCSGDVYRVRTTVEEAARIAHAEVVPLGNVWRTALTIRPDLPLQTPRGRVSLLGAYLVVCVLAHYILRESLHALDLPGVRPAHVAFVHRVAHDLVLDAR
jgi:hypothetical protein